MPVHNGTRSMVAPELLHALEILPSFDFNEEILEKLKAGVPLTSRKPPPLSPAQQAVVCAQRMAPGALGAPEVRVLVYTPPEKASGLRPAYLHMHGGGFILGTPEINDASNRSLALELDCVVISVDYRLAPQTRFPGAVEDCYAALGWLVSQAEQLGVDPDRIAIGGESAGAGHAASLALRVRDRGEFRLRLQMLDSPMLDDRTGSNGDPHPYCGEFVWTPTSNRFGWRSLLGMEPGGPDVPAQAVPARAADLSGLAPAFILVGALDLFMEEAMEYARRLTRACVSCELHIIPGAYHGFGAAGVDQPLVRKSLALCRDALARALA